MKMIYLSGPLILSALVACAGSNDQSKVLTSPKTKSDSSGSNSKNSGEQNSDREPNGSRSAPAPSPNTPGPIPENIVQTIDHRSSNATLSTRFVDCELVKRRWARSQSAGNAPPVWNIDYPRTHSSAHLVIDEASKRSYVYGKENTEGYFGDSYGYWSSSQDAPENLGTSFCVNQWSDTQFALKILSDKIESESSFVGAQGKQVYRASGKFTFNGQSSEGRFSCVEDSSAFSDTPSYHITDDYVVKNCQVHIFEKTPYRSFVLQPKEITELAKRKVNYGVTVDGKLLVPKYAVTKASCNTSGAFAARIAGVYKGGCRVTAVFLEAETAPANKQTDERTLNLEIEVSFDKTIKIISATDAK